MKLSDVDWGKPPQTCLDHWAKIRLELSKGEVLQELYPPMSLRDQAQKQIDKLNRDLAEWIEIRDHQI